MEGARHAVTGGIHPDRVGCTDSHLRPSFSRHEDLMSQSSALSFNSFLKTHSHTHTHTCSQVIAVFDDGEGKDVIKIQ